MGKTMKEDNWSWYIPSDMHCQTLSDTNDCGVFVLMHIKSILSGKTLDATPTAFRDDILKTLYEHADKPIIKEIHGQPHTRGSDNNRRELAESVRHLLSQMVVRRTPLRSVFLKEQGTKRWLAELLRSLALDVYNFNDS